MTHIQLREMEDLPWLPPSLRDAVTDGIQRGINLADIYSVVSGHLARALEDVKADKIFDIGSGGGGPWLKLWPRLCMKRADVAIYFSDKMPNLPALRRIKKLLGSKAHVIERPLDPVKTELPGGFITMFSAFHHFSPEQAKAILSGAVQSNQGVAVFELTGRYPRSFLLALAVPLLMILMGPFIRPFRLSRIFWTYLIPLAPLIAFWDGIISCLKTYTPSECLSLLDGISKKYYVWRVGVENSRFLKMPITYLIGYPIKSDKL